MRPTVVTVALREAVSEDGLRRLADRFGGETIRIPRAAGRGPMHSTLAELLEQADLDRLTATMPDPARCVSVGVEPIAKGSRPCA